MPVPVKVRTLRPVVAPTVPSLLDTRRSPSGTNPTTADVVRARTLAGNAAVTAAMGGLPVGEGPGPASWHGQLLLASQNLVGNQAVATHGRTLPAPTTPAPPTLGVPGPGTRTAPPAKKPPTPVAKATPSAAPRPDQKDQKDQKDPGTAPQEGQDRGTAKKGAAGPRSPGADPKFQALRKDVGAKKRRIGSSHPPAKAEAGAAQAASVPPSDDREARGKAAHAEDMDAAQPKEFNKAEFVKAVEDAVAKRAPKNLDEADKFGESGKAEEVKKEVQGKVGEGKESSAKEIADTTHETPKPAPDEKPVVPLTADKVPGRPGTPDPNLAAPDPLPAPATDLSAGPAQVNQQLADAKVTEEQLSFDNAREPQFDKAVKDKKTLEAHSQTAPGQLRAGEGREIAQVKKVAATRGAAAMAALHATRVTTGKNVGAGKVATKRSDEEKRAQVTAILQEVFDTTKGDVEKILSDLDKTVDDQFTRDEKQARDRFTAEHEQGMADYKDRRYSGWAGKARWVKDLFADLPEEANRIYETAKAHYLTAMRQVITDIADTIERELRRAKDRIATGRKDLKAAVDKLPADLKAIGREAATDFEGKFDELRDTVNDKGTQLVDTLATKYTDAVKAVDDEIAAEKEKNKGLVSKASDAIGGVIRTIRELGSLLLGVLRKAASAVGAILKDPIGFLGNLVTAVGGGLKLFAKNAGRHLQQGVLAWLLGVGASAGLLLPPNFDVLGILMMLAALLGLTWANLRARLVRKVPDRAVTAAETAIPLVAETRKRGVAGLWSDLKSRIGDLKKDLIKNLVSYLLPTIVTAGITWILSLFNPASAFIRACKMIIDIIRFIVTQGRQIIEFVNTVLDAVIAIAKGGTGGVPALVERALARSIPVLVGALAAILGLGGIAGKVRAIFQKLARPVNRAIDWVIDKIVGLVKKLWAKLKASLDKRRSRDRRRPDQRGPGDTRRPTARRRPERRRPPDRRRPDRRKPRKRPDTAHRKEKDRSNRLDEAMAAARRVMARHARKPVGRDEVTGPLSAIRRKFRVHRVDLVDAGQVWAVEAEVNPKKKEKTDALVPGPKRGDHIFALAFGKQLGQAHTKSATAVQALELNRSPAARILVYGLAIARAKAAAIPELVVRKPRQTSGSDAHSMIYGNASREALLAINTVAVTVARYYQHRAEADLLARHLAVSAMQARLAVNHWIDAVIDKESLPFVQDKRLKLALGQQLLNQIRADLSATFAQLSGRGTEEDRRAEAEDATAPDNDLKRLDAALRDANALVRTGMPIDEIKARLLAVQRRHRLTALSLVVERLAGDHYVIHFVATINPSKTSRAENSPLSRKRAQADYGVLIKNSRRFQRFADANNVIIEVRPTNPDSVRHLMRGAWYKPVDIKAKTINDADTFLSIEPEKKGLVGFFINSVPQPKRRNLGKEDIEAGRKRYRMRVEERREYGQKMQKLARKHPGPGRFEVIGHVVHGYDRDKARHPIAGDHDLYDIRRPDGTEIPQAEYDLLIQDMRDGKFGVMHGAVVRWDPDDPHEKEMRDKLVRQHQRGGGEGLVRFTPGQPMRFVVAETPLWTDRHPWVPPAGRPD
jgi:hypothetical protein